MTDSRLLMIVVKTLVPSTVDPAFRISRSSDQPNLKPNLRPPSIPRSRDLHPKSSSAPRKPPHSPSLHQTPHNALSSSTTASGTTTRMQPWALVTPSSRGIGLELARRLLRTTKVPVVATARRDLDKVREEVLKGLEVRGGEERLRVLRVDVLGSSYTRQHRHDAA